jgi:hypothetical protein
VKEKQGAKQKDCEARKAQPTLRTVVSKLRIHLSTTKTKCWQIVHVCWPLTSGSNRLCSLFLLAKAFVALYTLVVVFVCVCHVTRVAVRVTGHGSRVRGQLAGCGDQGLTVFVG